VARAGSFPLLGRFACRLVAEVAQKKFVSKRAGQDGQGDAVPYNCLPIQSAAANSGQSPATPVDCDDLTMNNQK
jgi:hypothetical protein